MIQRYIVLCTIHVIFQSGKDIPERKLRSRRCCCEWKRERPRFGSQVEDLAGTEQWVGIGTHVDWGTLLRCSKPLRGVSWFPTLETMRSMCGKKISLFPNTDVPTFRQEWITPVPRTDRWAPSFSSVTQLRQTVLVFFPVSPLDFLFFLPLLPRRENL